MYQNIIITQVIKFIAAEESGPVCVSEMDKGILRYIHVMCADLYKGKCSIMQSERVHYNTTDTHNVSSKQSSNVSKN